MLAVLHRITRTGLKSALNVNLNMNGGEIEKKLGYPVKIVNKKEN